MGVMATGQGRLEAGASGGSGLAKPLFLQRLERSLRLDSFLRQTATIYNKDITRYDSRCAGRRTRRLNYLMSLFTTSEFLYSEVVIMLRLRMEFTSVFSFVYKTAVESMVCGI